MEKKDDRGIGAQKRKLITSIQPADLVRLLVHIKAGVLKKGNKRTSYSIFRWLRIRLSRYRRSLDYN